MCLRATSDLESALSVTFWPPALGRAKPQKSTRRTKPWLKSCASCALYSLLVADRGGHGGDDRVCHSAFVEFLDLGGREIEVNRRLFDAFDNRPFGEASFHQPDHTFIGQCRCFLQFRRSILT